MEIFFSFGLNLVTTTVFALLHWYVRMLICFWHNTYQVKSSSSASSLRFAVSSKFVFHVSSRLMASNSCTTAVKASTSPSTRAFCRSCRNLCSRDPPNDGSMSSYFSSTRSTYSGSFLSNERQIAQMPLCSRYVFTEYLSRLLSTLLLLTVSNPSIASAYAPRSARRLATLSIALFASLFCSSPSNRSPAWLSRSTAVSFSPRPSAFSPSSRRYFAAIPSLPISVYALTARRRHSSDFGCDVFLNALDASTYADATSCAESSFC
mmetsp:Transcript_6576/g.17142  ORF Transcript_6576/g.17142 Transcript_6576/m.17142 type:complete len:264 (-) Transcript_6576:232-1023(-)